MPADLRLPGRAHGLFFGFPEELWLRQDHLLCVSLALFFENYQRLYYRDIESLTIVRTPRFWALNLLFALPLLAGLALLPLASPAPSLVLFALWLALTLANLLRGPTCKTVIRTRITTRTLTSLRRLRNAERAAALLEARVREAQSGEPGAETSAAPESRPPTPPAVPASPAVPAAALPPPPPLPRSPVSPRWHQALAALMLLQGGVATAAFLQPTWPFAAALVALILITVFACVGALIAQRRLPLPSGVRRACVGLTIFQLLSAYLFVFATSLLNSASLEGDRIIAELAATYQRVLSTHVWARTPYLLYAGIAFLTVLLLSRALRSLQRP